jgi:hypothetical protein
LFTRINHAVPLDSHAGPLPADLLDQETSEELRTRWNEIRGSFVDEPRSAVRQGMRWYLKWWRKLLKYLSANMVRWKTGGKKVMMSPLKISVWHYSTTALSSIPWLCRFLLNKEGLKVMNL